MEFNLLTTAGLAVMGLLALLFIALHWRYHPQQTPLDSFDELKRRLGRGTPVLLQFHAPL